MLKLKIQKEPYWLDLGSGVKVKVKPCNSAVFYEAKAFMNAKVADMAKRYKEAKDSSLIPHQTSISENIPLNLEDVQKREAFADQNLILGLALAGIIEWDGVFESDSDEKAPLTPEKVEELFTNFWIIAENFRQQYCGIHEMIEAEKNASTPEPSGTLETGEAIVKDAEKKKHSAPFTSADTLKQP